jgi:Protein of unknown function (DUF3300)
MVKKELYPPGTQAGPCLHVLNWGRGIRIPQPLNWNEKQKKVRQTMTTKPLRTKSRGWTVQSLVAVLCVVSLAPGDAAAYAQPARQQDASAGQAAPMIPNDQLDSLVAPIALYPDPLLSQVLVASTYPLEIIQLQQWIQKNSTLKGDDLTNAVQKQDWDPSIQAMAVFPDLVKRLADDIKWTTDLGNAFLAQQSDVMDAVQRMRMKAQAAGNLKSNEQMNVETKVVETKTVVVIQPANPQVVYVPTYNPVVVYGPPVYMYPYPPIYYPPPSYYAAGAVFAFGVGVAVGSYYRGGWGYNSGWGHHNTVNININNNYISHYNRTNINNVNRTNINNVNRNNINNVNRNGNNTWQHNPQHRGGTPYSNKATANQYGGTTRGDSMSTRQANARQQQGSSTRQQPSASNRGATAANRAGSNAGAGTSNLSAAGANRAGSNAGTRPSNPGANATNRAGSNVSANPSNMGANRGSGGGNNIGNRQIPTGNASGNTGAFGGASSKASAQASSARGASSMGASRGGGGARSGGGGRPR